MLSRSTASPSARNAARTGQLARTLNATACARDCGGAYHELVGCPRQAAWSGQLGDGHASLLAGRSTAIHTALTTRAPRQRTSMGALPATSPSTGIRSCQRPACSSRRSHPEPGRMLNVGVNQHQRPAGPGPLGTIGSVPRELAQLTLDSAADRKRRVREGANHGPVSSDRLPRRIVGPPTPPVGTPSLDGHDRSRSARARRG